MSRPAKLDAEEVGQRLQSLSNWKLREGKLHRDFQFENFDSAFDFMTKVAKVAGKMDHHPEWFNVYNRVSVDLSTHDAGGLTKLDFELAQAMDRAAS